MAGTVNVIASAIRAGALDRLPMATIPPLEDTRQA
jgi:hypothetical protein